VKRRVQKHRKAKRDVLRVFVDIGQHNLDAAERFLISFNSDVRRLADMPGIGAKREFADPKLAHLRSLPVTGFTNYLVFYRYDDRDVQILRVIHGARDLERALGE
jgi:toxin ParE1/3/4